MAENISILDNFARLITNNLDKHSLTNDLSRNIERLLGAFQRAIVGMKRLMNAETQQKYNLKWEELFQRFNDSKMNIVEQPVFETVVFPPQPIVNNVVVEEIVQHIVTEIVSHEVVTEPVVIVTEPVVVVTEPVVIVTEPVVVVTEPVVIVTEPVVIVTEPVVIVTEPVVVATQNP
jgi:hypothetical protein